MIKSARYLALLLCSMLLSLALASCATSRKPLTPEELAQQEEARAICAKAKPEYYEAKSDEDRGLAMQQLQKAAEMGDTEAMYILGYHFYSAAEPTDADKEQAVKWLKMASAQGHPSSMSTLAVVHMRGFGVRQSETKGFRLFVKAANEGDVFAMYNLAQMYMVGYAIERDYERSAHWFKKAAKKGDVRSMVYLGNYYLRGRGTIKSFGSAEKWFKRASAAGDPEAMFLIGLMWKNGIGRDMELVRAVEWMLKAAKKGYKPAIERLDELRALIANLASGGAEEKAKVDPKVLEQLPELKVALEKAELELKVEAERRAEAEKKAKAVSQEATSKEGKPSGKPEPKKSIEQAEESAISTKAGCPGTSVVNKDAAPDESPVGKTVEKTE